MNSESKGLPTKQKTLGKRSLQAAGWNFVTTFSTYALRLVSNLIMTRLLMPEAFGMLSMAVVVLTALNMLTDIGIAQSVIREKDGGTTRFLRVAWVVKLARNCVIAMCVLVAALLLRILSPHLAPDNSVYASPEMPGLIAMVAIAPILAGLSSTSIELAGREMNYKRLTFFSIFSQIISTACMVLFAQISPTVWALMVGMLTSSLLLCLFSHTLLPGPRMRFEWEQEISDRLWSFGKWILGSSMVGFVSNNADKIILGALLGPTTFGIYVIAQIWVQAGKLFISQMANRIGFPAIAEIYRERPKEVPRLYRKFQTALDGICLLGFLGLFFGGPLLIQSLYSETYHSAAIYLQIMSVAFLAARFETLTGFLLNIGDGKSFFIAMSLNAFLICITIPMGYTARGVEGAILASSLSPLASIPFVLYRLRKSLGDRQVLFDAIWFVCTLLVGIFVWMH